MLEMWSQVPYSAKECAEWAEEGAIFNIDEMGPIEFSVLKVTALAGISSLDLCHKYSWSTYFARQGSWQDSWDKTLLRKKAMDTTWVVFPSLGQGNVMY